MTSPAPSDTLTHASTMKESHSLSTLPVELLGLIIRQLALDVVHIHLKTRRHPSEHLYENLDAGASSRPGLVALSETNSFFKQLCAPSLWKKVSLHKRNNADYLYFFHVILPRHGKHVRSIIDIDLDGHNHKGRENVPAYLAQSLGISSRFGYSSSTTNPLDLRLLGAELLLPDLPAGTKEYDPSPKLIRHRTQLGFQSTRLLSMMISSSFLPNLSELSINVSAPLNLISSTFAHLRTVLAVKPTQLTTLTLNPFTTEDMSDLRTKAKHVKATQEALAGLLESCPFITDLDLALSWEDRLDNDALRPVIEALRGKEKLDRLALRDLHVDKAWIASPWTAQVTYLELGDVKGNHQDIIVFAGHFCFSLKELSIELRVPEWTIVALPYIPVIPDIQFLQLTELTMSSDIPLNFLLYFRDSPLEYIRSYQDNGAESGGVEAAEWRTVFQDHGSTLISVCGHNGNISDEEKEELEAEAEKLEFSLHLYTSPQENN